MIEYKHTEKDGVDSVELMVQGGIFDIAAEVGFMVGQIFYELKELHGLAGASLFRTMVLTALMPGAPTWDVTPSPGAFSFRHVKRRGGGDG